MLDKILCARLMFGLILSANFSVLAQTPSARKVSRQLNSISKKEFLDNLRFAQSKRANELLDKESFIKVNKDSLSPEAMQDADKTQQKKKFAGIGTTTAIVIGGAVIAAIVIVLATKGRNDRTPNGPIYCSDIRSPCP